MTDPNEDIGKPAKPVFLPEPQDTETDYLDNWFMHNVSHEVWIDPELYKQRKAELVNLVEARQAEAIRAALEQQLQTLLELAVPAKFEQKGKHWQDMGIPRKVVLKRLAALQHNQKKGQA